MQSFTNNNNILFSDKMTTSSVSQWMAYNAGGNGGNFCWMTLEEDYGDGVYFPIKGRGWNALKKFNYNGYILHEKVIMNLEYKDRRVVPQKRKISGHT